MNLIENSIEKPIEVLERVTLIRNLRVFEGEVCKVSWRLRRDECVDVQALVRRFLKGLKTNCQTDCQV